DSKMQRVSCTTVQQVHDRTLFYRNGRWVDARIMEKQEDAPADRTVEFGSKEYFDLADNLASEGRCGVLAMRGDVYVIVKGERVLVKGAGANPGGDGK